MSEPHPLARQVNEILGLLARAGKELELVQKKSPILSGFRRRERLIQAISQATGDHDRSADQDAKT